MITKISPKITTTIENSDKSFIYTDPNVHRKHTNRFHGDDAIWPETTMLIRMRAYLKCYTIIIERCALLLSLLVLNLNRFMEPEFEVITMNRALINIRQATSD